MERRDDARSPRLSSKMQTGLIPVLAGLLLLLAQSGCSTGGDKPLACFNDSDCPPACTCSLDLDFLCENKIPDGFPCGGTCDRETECPEGTSCRLDRVGDTNTYLYACLFDGAGGTGGTGGSGGAGGTGGSGGTGASGGSGGAAGTGGVGGCVTPPTSQECSLPPQGLAAWWTFDTDGGAVQSGLDGALMGGATAGASGLVDGALSLDGVDDFVEVDDSPALTTPSGLTLDAWVNPTTFTNDGAIVSKYNSSVGVAEVSWYLGHFGDGRLRLTVCEAWPANCTAVDTVAKVLSEGCWHFVAATFDATKAEEDQAKIYVDGAKVVSSPNPDVNETVGSISDSGVPVHVGTFTPISGMKANFWHGLIDELEIYNRALSQLDIEGIYNAGASGKCKPNPAQ